MKWFVSLSLTLVCLAGHTQNASPRKIALVIAIGNYPEDGGWNKISSLHDIKYIRTALESQGFRDADIDTLTDEKATHAGIISAIDRLIAKAGSGDIVVFHFSGHGQQIYDDNHDEIDGYDEALVAYDAKARYSATGYQGQNHVRDDELGAKLKLLRKKIGNQGSLLVILDACHSGTATRGQEVAITRGTAEKLEPDGYEKTLNLSRGAPVNEGVFDDKELLSNMVVISAASSDQLNYETKDADQQGVGSLSYAFSRALSQLSGDINYQILFEKIKSDIQSWKPTQNPQIEGNTKQQVLGGKFIATGDIIRVEKWNPDLTIEISRGTLHGIQAGARFKVYPLEVTDFKTSKPVAMGEITTTEIIHSTGTLDGGNPEQGKIYKVVFESMSFGNLQVAVKINLPDASAAGMIRKKLEESKNIQLDNPAADIAITTYGKGVQQQLQVISRNDSILWTRNWPSDKTNSLSGQDADAISNAIRKYTHAQFLRSLETPANDPSMPNVVVEFIPALVQKSGDKTTIIKKLTLAEITDSLGNLNFPEAMDQAAKNDVGLIIKVRNYGDFPVYLSVLDIQPDNVVNILIPREGEAETSGDYIFKEKTEREIPYPITFYPPYGREFFKVLLSRQAMDLKGVQSRGPASLNPKTSFESFFNSVQNEEDKGTRGGKTPPVKIEELKIVPFTFNIVRPK